MACFQTVTRKTKYIPVWKYKRYLGLGLKMQKGPVSFPIYHFFYPSLLKYCLHFKTIYLCGHNSLLGFVFFRESWVRHIDAASKLFLDTEKQKREKLYNCEYYQTYIKLCTLQFSLFLYVWKKVSILYYHRLFYQS